MKVKTISATVKYSRQLQDGEWKGVEMGAEATIDPGEDRKEAQAALYRDLAAQLKELFTNGPQKALPAPQEEPVDPSWCPIHKVKMKRRKKKGQVWHSHKTKDGWCCGQVKRKGARR